MVEFKDLAGLSRPLTKLIEVVAEGVGGISRPFLTRKNVDAKAYEIKTITQAVLESQQLLGSVKYESGDITIEGDEKETPQLPDAQLDKRIATRFAYQEAKKQSNIEKITQYAADDLRKEETVADEKIDSDWTSRFFKIAEDITTDEMQTLWGKVLAGEVKKPKSYSLRTLELLKNISKEEAEVFVKLSKFAIQKSGKAFIFNPEDGEYLEKNFNIKFSDYLLLREIGLLVHNDLQYSTDSKAISEQHVFTCGTTAIVVGSSESTQELTINVVVFTQIGKQLLNLIDKEQANFEYVKKFASILKYDGVTIQYANITSFLDGGYRHDGLKDVPIE